MTGHRTNRPTPPIAARRLVIRRAAVPDATVLAELASRTFYDAFASQNTPEDMEDQIARSFGAERLEHEIEDPAATFLLAYGDPALPPVGYAKLLAGSAMDAVWGSEPIELGRLYVLQGRQRHGVGSELMRACLHEASRKRCDTIWLGVWERNHKAIEFYRRWGFERIGTQVFRLGSDDQTDLVMARAVAEDANAEAR